MAPPSGAAVLFVPLPPPPEYAAASVRCSLSAMDFEIDFGFWFRMCVSRHEALGTIMGRYFDD